MRFKLSTNQLTKVVSDLNQLLHNPSFELTFLMRHWSKIEGVLNRERSRLLKQIRIDDPIRAVRADCDLLGPLGSNTDEVRHTQALSYLFDPSRPHGFGSTILRQFLLTLVGVTNAVDQDIRDMVRIIEGAKTEIEVTAERRHRLNSSRSRKVRRTDLWIEIRNPRVMGLLVIENKIGSRELEWQLKDYELAVKERRHYAKCKRLFIFLTVDGGEPKSAGSEQWIPASYSRLARTLRDVLKENQNALAASWLRLYIASIGRNVLGLRVDSPDTINITRLQDYTGAVR